MNIRILHGKQGAAEAAGLAVVIDVFRAFSTACYAYAGGCKAIYPTGSIAEAYRRQEELPGALLVGERGGVMVEGFDFGNSPSLIAAADVRGRSIVHTTSAGTQGLIGAAQAEEVITGAFVNAAAIARYIRQSAAREVSLIAMGLGGTEPADEDTLCAEYLRDLLLNRPVDFAEIRRYLAEDSTTGRFLDLVGEASAPKEDFDYCLDLDRFAFVLRAEWEDGRLVLRQIPVSAG
ncbi:2-phosphosulfolactate phosphatase [Xylanibacillus composti]|uniref:Probable 2-phosphosulfolactate phosphatase n=1 Tax=Xylanibacillus composti TaxID=1572762 RepID=A0A8J4H4D4_9BACL|nr:2-phosphosulfolactate phosphatase [Xylanibacillus composti]MDT9724286.1 2-phosphosulfolactate phosphatase [Xylanibacillus composti]GIQ69282.1 putative 2-phosphosulfolactate phosphatase [Xylanibacillus composti]